MHEFLRAWENFKPNRRRNVLEGDEEHLNDSDVVCYPSWKNYVRQNDFLGRDSRLHLSLLPQPFFGDVSKARVIILSLNPGLSPVGYFAEFRVPEYRRAAIRTLRQRFDPKFPFLWFDPRFSWHAGFRYWHGKFATLIDKFKSEQGIERIQALQHFAKSVATMDLVPYHSSTFKLSAGTVNKLRSARLARDFVHDVLVPRARAGELLLVVTRKAKLWGLEASRNTIVYQGHQSRSAHLTGEVGEKILKQLKRHWPG